MRTIISHGVDLERLEAAAAFLTTFEVGFLDDAEKAKTQFVYPDAESRGMVQDRQQHARECREHAQVVRDAVAALERLEEER